MLTLPRLGVHYRLCEDLDGANSIASFNWPGIVVYLGGLVVVSVGTLVCSWYLSRWWFQILFIFTPTWGNNPFWLVFFQMGWFNHQLVVKHSQGTRWKLRNLLFIEFLGGKKPKKVCIAQALETWWTYPTRYGYLGMNTSEKNHCWPWSFVGEVLFGEFWHFWHFLYVEAKLKGITKSHEGHLKSHFSSWNPYAKRHIFGKLPPLKLTKLLDGKQKSQKQNTNHRKWM